MSPPPESAAVGRQPGFRHFHDQLEELKQRLLAMSERAESLVDLAVDALLTRDAAKAEAVISGDKEVDELEVQIESMAIELLALQQPMARDLRFIISAIKASSDLERVGDHSVNIAQSALRIINAKSDITPHVSIDEMARRARQMLGQAIDAFVRADGGLGRAVCLMDDEVDKLNDELFRIVVTHILEDPKIISTAIELLLVGRNLERVADLSTNIGEDAVYLAEGKQIKHHLEDRPKGPRNSR
jgi:phosphate transport system protein